MEDPGRVLNDVIAAGADAIMTSYGVMKQYRDLLANTPTYLRLDGGYSVYREEWLRVSDWRLLHTIEDARAVDDVAPVSSF